MFVQCKFLQHINIWGIMFVQCKFLQHINIWGIMFVQCKLLQHINISGIMFVQCKLLQHINISGIMFVQCKLLQQIVFVFSVFNWFSPLDNQGWEITIYIRKCHWISRPFYGELFDYLVNNIFNLFTTENCNFYWPMDVKHSFVSHLCKVVKLKLKLNQFKSNPQCKNK
jgi:hypothetical protein